MIIYWLLKGKALTMGFASNMKKRRLTLKMVAPFLGFGSHTAYYRETKKLGHQDIHGSLLPDGKGNRTN